MHTFCIFKFVRYDSNVKASKEDKRNSRADPVTTFCNISRVHLFYVLQTFKILTTLKYTQRICRYRIQLEVPKHPFKPPKERKIYNYLRAYL